MGVRLDAHDPIGREVAGLVNERRDRAPYRFIPSRLPSGAVPSAAPRRSHVSRGAPTRLRTCARRASSGARGARPRAAHRPSARRPRSPSRSPGLRAAPRVRPCARSRRSGSSRCERPPGLRPSTRCVHPARLALAPTYTAARRRSGFRRRTDMRSLRNSVGQPAALPVGAEDAVGELARRALRVGLDAGEHPLADARRARSDCSGRRGRAHGGAGAERHCGARLLAALRLGLGLGDELPVHPRLRARAHLARAGAETDQRAASG